MMANRIKIARAQATTPQRNGSICLFRVKAGIEGAVGGETDPAAGGDVNGSPGRGIATFAGGGINYPETAQPKEINGVARGQVGADGGAQVFQYSRRRFLADKQGGMEVEGQFRGRYYTRFVSGQISHIYLL